MHVWQFQIKSLITTKIIIITITEIKRDGKRWQERGREEKSKMYGK